MNHSKAKDSRAARYDLPRQMVHKVVEGAQKCSLCGLGIDIEQFDLHTISCKHRAQLMEFRNEIKRMNDKIKSFEGLINEAGNKYRGFKKESEIIHTLK